MRTNPQRLTKVSIGLAVSAATLFGCSAAEDAVSEKAAESAIEAAAGGDADVDLGDDGSFSIETEDGSFSTSSGSIPESWPSDIPFPKDFTAVTSSEISGVGGEATTTVNVTTADSIDDLDAMYANAFASWSETLRARSGSGGSVSWQVGYELDGRTVYIAAVAADSATNLTITTTSKSSEQDSASGTGAETEGSGSGGVVDAVGAGDALDAVGIEGIASALSYATKAERFEVDGDTIHLYLGSGSSIHGSTACIVTGSILEDGQFAVIHEDGQEFVC